MSKRKGSKRGAEAGILLLLSYEHIHMYPPPHMNMSELKKRVKTWGRSRHVTLSKSLLLRNRSISWSLLTLVRTAEICGFSCVANVLLMCC